MPACLVVTSSSAAADAVVVGGGTIGAWCAVFLKAAGLPRVVLLEADRLGKGATSRGAGVGPAPGGTRPARPRPRRAARPLGAPSFRPPPRRAPARLRLRRTGLLHAVLHRRRGRAGP